MSNLVNYIYDAVCDYIEDNAPRNMAREEYANAMSRSQYNNNHVAELVDIISLIVEGALRSSRSEREDERIINNTVCNMVDRHCAMFCFSDKRISDELDDATFSQMKKLAIEWEDILDELDGRSRGRDRQAGSGLRGRSRDDFNNRRSNSRGRDRGRGGRDDGRRGGLVMRDDRRDVEVAGGGMTTRRNGVFSQIETRQSGTSQREEYVPRGRDVSRSQREEPVRHSRNEEFTDRRGDDTPFDFWQDGEHWQVAHKSDWTWRASARQKGRRMYNPDEEVCFLVRSEDGTIREEFVEMTDDLNQSAHEIRELNRPHMRPAGPAREEYDPLTDALDLDVPDRSELLNKVKRSVVRTVMLDELKLASMKTIDPIPSVSKLEEATLTAAAAAVDNDEDILIVPAILNTVLPSDDESNETLKSIAVTINDHGSDLLILSHRLNNASGALAENIMRYIDDHYTTEVNNVLNKQYGIADLSIESFVTDFQDLLNCKTFDLMGGSGFRTQFLQRTRGMVSSLQIIEGDSISEQLENLDLLPAYESDSDALMQFRNDLAILFKPVTVAYCHIHSSDLGMVGKEVRYPDPAQMPKLANLLRSIYTRIQLDTLGGRVYIMTTDNMVFELVAQAGARDIVGICLP